MVIFAVSECGAVAVITVWYISYNRTAPQFAVNSKLKTSPSVIVSVAVNQFRFLRFFYHMVWFWLTPNCVYLHKQTWDLLGSQLDKSLLNLRSLLLWVCEHLRLTGMVTPHTKGFWCHVGTTSPSPHLFNSRKW